MYVDLRVEGVAAQSVFVVNGQLADREGTIGTGLSGEIALDRLDGIAREFKAVELRQAVLGLFDETDRIDSDAGNRFLADRFQCEIADQNLARQCMFDHACEFDRHIADDVTVHGRIEPFGMVKLVAVTDMKTCAQQRHSTTSRFLSGDRIVCQDQMHEVIEVGVGLEPCIAVPDVEAIAGGRAGKIHQHAPAHQTTVCGIQGAGQTAELGHLFKGTEQTEADDIEQCHGTIVDIADAVTLDDLIDDCSFISSTSERLAQAHLYGFDTEQMGSVVHLSCRELSRTGQQVHDELMCGTEAAVSW